MARFEREGDAIPDWMFWMPLVVQHAQVAYEDRWDWERENIPQHSDVRREREEEEYYARLFELNDQEIALLSRFREMDRDEREVLGAMLEPQTFCKIRASLARNSNGSKL